jgi:acyl carrier protein
MLATMARLADGEHETLYHTMLDIIADQLALNPSSLRPETDLVGDFDADSLDMLQIIVSVEDEFGVTVPETDFSHMTTVAGAVDEVERLLS